MIVSTASRWQKKRRRGKSSRVQCCRSSFVTVVAFSYFDSRHPLHIRAQRVHKWKVIPLFLLKEFQVDYYLCGVVLYQISSPHAVPGCLIASPVWGIVSPMGPSGFFIRTAQDRFVQQVGLGFLSLVLDSWSLLSFSSSCRLAARASRLRTWYRAFPITPTNNPLNRLHYTPYLKSVKLSFIISGSLLKWEKEVFNRESPVSLYSIHG